MTSISSFWKMGAWVVSVKVVLCSLFSLTHSLFQPCEQVAFSQNAIQKRDFRAGKERTGQGS